MLGSGVSLVDYAVHYLEIIVACMGVGAKQVCFEQRGNQEWAHIYYLDGQAVLVVHHKQDALTVIADCFAEHNLSFIEQMPDFRRFFKPLRNFGTGWL